MPYRIMVAGAVGGQNFEAGDILDLPEEYGRGWVEQGLAGYTDDQPTILMSAADLPLTFPQPQEPPPAEEGDESPPEAPEPAAAPPPAPEPPPPAPEPEAGPDEEPQ